MKRRYPFQHLYLQCLSVIIAAITAGADTHAAAKPSYQVQSCCAPCPQTQDQRYYSTSYLELFILLERGKDDWLFRSEQELATVFGPDAASRRQLAVLVDKLRAHGTQLVIIYPPTRGLVHPTKLPENHWFDYATAAYNYRLALANLRDTGAIVPDLTALLDDTSTPEFYFRRDHHWTPYGAERTAELVAATIRQQPAYANLEKQQFTTRRVGIMRKDGSLQVAWRRICGDGFADQYVDEFVTEMSEEGDLLADNDNSADALFSDDALPDITLVGTSFSQGAANYNFSGYLKQHLNVDILNEAMAGGSYDGALIQYLLSDTFRDYPPTFLFWELPAYHDMSSDIFYRQAQAMADGGCRNKKTSLSQRTQLRLGDNEILFNGDGELKTLLSKDQILELQFSEQPVHEVKFTVWYVNGRKDRTKLELSERVENNGRFVVRLRHDGEWRDFNFLSLDLEVEGAVPAEAVTATLCPYYPSAIEDS